jgi:hypothetical protein
LEALEGDCMAGRAEAENCVISRHSGVIKSSKGFMLVTAFRGASYLLSLFVRLCADPGKREKWAAAFRTTRAWRSTVNPYRGKYAAMSMFAGMDGPQERETGL